MAGPQLTDITGIGPAAAAVLTKGGFKTVDAVAAAAPTAIGALSGFGPARAKAVIAAAKRAAKAPAAKPIAKKPAAKKTTK